MGKAIRICPDNSSESHVYDILGKQIKYLHLILGWYLILYGEKSMQSTITVIIWVILSKNNKF